MSVNINTLRSMKETKKRCPSQSKGAFDVALLRIIQSEGHVLRCLQYLQSLEKALFSLSTTGLKTHRQNPDSARSPDTQTC